MGAGIRHGRDAEIANLRAIADIGITNVTSTVIATRGERLALSHDRFSRRDQEPGAFPVEVLAVVEINADDCIAAGVAFDPTTSKPPSRSSMPDTSRAKRLPTRIRGRPSRPPAPRLSGTSYRRQLRTG